MKNQNLTRGANPMLEISSRHEQITNKFQNVTASSSGPDADVTALMSFNGYYTLNTASGAFFAVDTNVHINANSTNPIYVVDLLISLDGKTSFRFPFNGTFDGTHLVQMPTADATANIDLTFTRTDGSDGTTATLSGTIVLQNATPAQVWGPTYNNPIPASLFIGDFYETLTDDVAPVKVMSIKPNNQLFYDYGLDTGTLTQVPSYTYNMNMYYFSFPQGEKTASLIMGTAAVSGLACNNTVIDKSVTPNTTTVRSLLTIPGGTMEPFGLLDFSGKELARFSGYYRIPEIAPLAFISVQAQYTTVVGALGWDANVVMISVSLDGVTSSGYYYDPLKMTFKNNTLVMPDQKISITFNRGYNAANGSLVTISALIDGKLVSGNTLLNPVPLTVFGGATMTNSHGDTLTVDTDNKVVYNGTKMDSIIYVPLMYILAYPVKNPHILMSFGTDGLRGNTCIVTDSSVTPAKVSFVFAINGAE